MAGLLHYLWSRVAGSNANSDAQINWAEGMAPSAVNDSGRAMMASLAGYRDDIAGAIITGGTSTNYTVGSYQVFDTLAHMDKMVVAFTPHATNGATVTLNVDGLGAKPLRSSPSVELPAGSLILGTPYTCLYNSSDAVFYLHGGVGAANAYSIPLGAGMDYWGATAPSSIFAFPAGQQISQTTYATLYALFGSNKYGADGGGLFYLPNKAGKVSAMKESVATLLTTAGGGIDGATLGATSLLQNVTLVGANIPTISSSGSNTITVTSNDNLFKSASATTLDFNPVSAAGFRTATNDASFAPRSSSGTQTINTTYTNGSPTATKIVQPTIICNYIIRVL